MGVKLFAYQWASGNFNSNVLLDLGMSSRLQPDFSTAPRKQVQKVATGVATNLGSEEVSGMISLHLLESPSLVSS